MVAAATLQEPPSTCDIANSLARGWKVTEERATRAINAALVLCADHELNVSAFAGQTATLSFSGSEDVSLQTSFVVDDTAVTAS